MHEVKRWLLSNHVRAKCGDLDSARAQRPHHWIDLAGQQHDVARGSSLAAAERLE